MRIYADVHGVIIRVYVVDIRLHSHTYTANIRSQLRICSPTYDLLR